MRRHPLASRDHDQTFLPVPVPASSLKDDDSGLHKPWDFYYRKSAPERAHVQVGTLGKMWKELKGLGLVLAPRKKEWSKLCQSFARSDKRQAARQAAEREKADDSSSSSSSSSSS
eukprot:256737-Karenia_brevis.AAC.1